MMSATNSTTGDGDAAAADRVEKKSIDEAIASFAMLVRSLVASLFLEEAESLENDAHRVIVGNQPFLNTFFFARNGRRVAGCG